MHALTIISALYPTIEQSEQTEYFASLTQAHSRFVLLLQATVHSSPSLIPPESEELRWRPRRFFNQQSTIRELTFPAPLSFSQTYQSDDGTSHCSSNTHTASGSSRSRFFRPKGLQNRTRNSSPLHANNPPATLSKKGSRSLSIFRGRRASKISAPPPPSIPQTLKLYSTAWRRTLVHQTSNISRTHPEFFTDDDGDDGSALDSDVTNLSLRRPHRRFASVNTSSSASSVTSPSSSRSRPGSIEGYPSPASLPFNLSNGVIPRLTSPHDLSLATLRTRAPILRVFVPCTELEQDSDGIIQCENQLIDSGLWEHLSAGDIVCNLGYVPSEDSSNSSAAGDEVFLPTGKHSTLQHQISTSTASSSTGDTRKRWLLFNGNCLLPYSPPDVLPLTDPLSLPTPWYYTHIMNSQENPRFFILRLPLPRATVDHEAGENWELIAVQTKVRSLHSAGGWALVKQYRWTAKVFRTAGPKDGARDTLGEGWTGEWTLEGEGTKEGRQVLQECLRGENGESMEWEFVRERSGPGRMWFKLITSSPPAVDFTDDVHAQIL
ncbi:hypothetical protein AX16_002649 [Volvariella volvacea WC 439]|nr:hypothetical protein AX16_002649 [Volvariella volvacea WC 439]